MTGKNVLNLTQAFDEGRMPPLRKSIIRYIGQDLSQTLKDGPKDPERLSSLQRRFFDTSHMVAYLFVANNIGERDGRLVLNKNPRTMVEGIPENIGEPVDPKALAANRERYFEQLHARYIVDEINTLLAELREVMQDDGVAGFLEKGLISEEEALQIIQDVEAELDEQLYFKGFGWPVVDGIKAFTSSTTTGSAEAVYVNPPQELRA